MLQNISHSIMKLYDLIIIGKPRVASIGKLGSPTLANLESPLVVSIGKPRLAFSYLYWQTVIL